MQFASTVFASLLAAVAVAAPIEKTPILVNFNVKRTSTTESGGRRAVMRAAGAVDLQLENEYSYYLAELSVGTPGQTMQVDVDTGSSDMWLPAANSGYPGTPFDGASSSTFKKVEDGFRIGYGDGSTATGYYASDKVAIGNIELNDVEFGYATNTTVKQGGLLGVGYMTNEASAALSGSDKTYDNFPVELKKQGKINKLAYSLYLNSADAESGSILFGAIDHAKYSGDLALLDVVLIDDSGSTVKEPTAFFVPLEGISQGEDKLAKQSYPALLDSGTTLIYAPGDIADQVAKKLGAHHVPLINMYVGSCTPDVEDIEFEFGSTTIKVPAKDLMFKALGKDSKVPGCIAGIMPNSADYYILGDTFLRSAYVYYDLEANKVGVAQVNYTEESKIEMV